MKIVCSPEIKGKTLIVDVVRIDGGNAKQGTRSFAVTGDAELDILIPIFTEFRREDREEYESKLKYSVVFRLTPISMDCGALLIEYFELYIHDCKRDI